MPTDRRRSVAVNLSLRLEPDEITALGAALRTLDEPTVRNDVEYQVSGRLRVTRDATDRRLILLLFQLRIATEVVKRRHIPKRTV